ncbi:NUDIX hydrolase [Kitasatospora sp. NPDC096140]|uniref:NUDIX hydrolase n=1 Tax=Kitasatospora sp. NPDC096140 TaxID=3155425 RepID=UPI00332D9215
MIDFEVLTNLAACDGTERIGVGVVVRDASGRIPVIRRSPHDVLPGVWEYACGSREDCETVPDGAARELAEETGLTGLPLEYARHPDFTNQRGLGVRPFAFTTVVPDGESDLRLGDEGLAVRMVPLGEVLALKVLPYLQHDLPMLAEASTPSFGRTS